MVIICTTESSDKTMSILCKMPSVGHQLLWILRCFVGKNAMNHLQTNNGGNAKERTSKKLSSTKVKKHCKLEILHFQKTNTVIHLHSWSSVQWSPSQLIRRVAFGPDVFSYILAALRFDASTPDLWSGAICLICEKSPQGGARDWKEKKQWRSGLVALRKW